MHYDVVTSTLASDTQDRDRRFLLSIVVPTRNRYEYLIPLVELLLESNRTDFEVVVQDNSDTNEPFLTRFGDCSDDRLSYSYKGGWLSVIDNCDLGVARAKGEYVCMLGDDDGILVRNSIKLVEWLKMQGVDAAVLNVLSYTWPGTEHAVWKDRFAGLMHTEFSFSIRQLDAKLMLNRVLYQGGAMGLQQLPRVYHGFVRRDMLDKVRGIAGSFFPGPSPDMANAVALAQVVERCVFADLPAVIAGQCPKSTGGQGARKQHHGAIESQSHLPADTASKWSFAVPRFWSGPTIYSESLRRAVHAMSGVEAKEINYSFLYAACLVFEPQYFSEIFRTALVEPNIGKRFTVICAVFYFYVLLTMQRGLRFLGNLCGAKTFAPGRSIRSIREAVCFLEEEFGSREFIAPNWQ